jgi:hypothetical protein
VRIVVSYISYWDASNWRSEVEIMNIQDYQTQYRISVYDRDGSLKWQDVRSLTAHQTERIVINSKVPSGGHKEGLVIVEPYDAVSQEEL